MIDNLQSLKDKAKNFAIKNNAEDWKKWRSMRNRLPNLQLLEGNSNRRKRKWI